MSDETWPWYALQTKKTQARDQISSLNFNIKLSTINTRIYEVRDSTKLLLPLIIIYILSICSCGVALGIFEQ